MSLNRYVLVGEVVSTREAVVMSQVLSMSCLRRLKEEAQVTPNAWTAAPTPGPDRHSRTLSYSNTDNWIGLAIMPRYRRPRSPTSLLLLALVFPVFLCKFFDIKVIFLGGRECVLGVRSASICYLRIGLCAGKDLFNNFIESDIG